MNADESEKERLRKLVAAETPELASEFDQLTEVTARSGDFLDTPALVLEAREIARYDTLLEPGTTIGPYRIARFVAHGGMGDVYRATDERLQRDVAVKMLAHDRTAEPRRVDRFMHEARVTAALSHPNIIRVYDVGRFGDRAYLVAEFLEGETLREHIGGEPMPAAEVLRIGGEIARGLAAAHAAGLVHRDLKPDNIYVTNDGVTKILDFGIAKLVQDDSDRSGYSTVTGVVLGTAGYMAPEQIRNEPVDRRADLFALGAVLFEMLTGQRAFPREHVVESLHAILHDPPSTALAERNDVPAGLREIVNRLLEKSPADRFQSAEEVIEALDAVEPAIVAPAAAVRKTDTRPLWLATLLIVVASIGAFVRYARRDVVPAPPAVASPARPITLAILPVRTIGAAQANDLLDAGLSDVLIGRLGQLASVRVLPFTASERVRGAEPGDAARRLGADRVLAVTLQRDGSRVRAVPRLLTKTGDVIWSTTVDTDASSVFSVQDIIVMRVVDELAPRLSAGAKTRLAQAGTRNNAAWEAYLRGRGYVLSPTPHDLTAAREAFEEAIKLDPGYADAWAGLGSAYKRLPIGAGASAEALRKAGEAAEHALSLDPANAEAHSVLGTVAFWYEWDYPKAERLLRRALELQPSSADAEVFLAHLYANTGRADESLEEIRRARALDPSWPVARAHEAHFLFMARRYAEALARADETLKVTPKFWPAHTFRAFALIGLKRYDEAVREFDTLVALRRSEGSPLQGPSAYKGYALALLGRRDEAERFLEELQRQSSGNRGTGEALILHSLGRDDEALRRLNAVVDQRDQSVTFLGVYPWWDDLRNVPAFRQVLGRANLLAVSDKVRR
jgi:tetratricopeptide (TPR) repeat protein/TolB-like protein/tRNA A-37 threonylcarbamoyl transferase component Bud32